MPLRLVTDKFTNRNDVYPIIYCRLRIQLSNYRASPFLPNYNLFSNVQSFFYWSGTGWAPDTTLYAWYFHFGNGYQVSDAKSFDFDALAVRPGQVGTAVPEPASMLLFGVSLLGLMGTMRRRLAFR